MMRIGAAACVMLVAACSRGGAVASGDASTDGATASATLDAARGAPEEPKETPATYGEARRARLERLDDEPALAKNVAAIKAHFGGSLPPSMNLQAVPLEGGRQALFLEADADDARPIAILADASGAPIWIKEHPAGGLSPPVKGLALAPRPENGLALFFYDVPTRLLGVRMWDEAGLPFADLQLFDLPACDAVSAVYWPGRGWIAVAAFAGGARAELLREGGSPAWHGIRVGSPWRAAAPATLVIDGDASWMLIQHATRGGADHVIAIRYDVVGNALWKQPVDLGAVARVQRTTERIDATRARPGVARVIVDGKAVELRSDGAVAR